MTSGWRLRTWRRLRKDLRRAEGRFVGGGNCACMDLASCADVSVHMLKIWISVCDSLFSL